MKRSLTGVWFFNSNWFITDSSFQNKKKDNSVVSHKGIHYLYSYPCILHHNKHNQKNWERHLHSSFVVKHWTCCSQDVSLPVVSQESVCKPIWNLICPKISSQEISRRSNKNEFTPACTASLALSYKIIKLLHFSRVSEWYRMQFLCLYAFHMRKLQWTGDLELC